jgi:hypothetical protein
LGDSYKQVSKLNVNEMQQSYLVERAPGVAVGNDTVETNLVEVRCLKLQHLVDTSAVYFIRCLEDLLVVTLAAEARSD